MAIISLEESSALMIVKPEIMELLFPERGDLLATIYQWNHENGFAEEVRERMVIDEIKAKEVWPRSKLTHPDWPHYDDFIKYISSGFSMVIFLSYNQKTKDAQAELRKRLGAMKPLESQVGTLRYCLSPGLKSSYPTLEKYGITLNGVHGAKNSYEAGEEARALYANDIGRIARFLKQKKEPKVF